jgi:hypothetical protein
MGLTAELARLLLGSLAEYVMRHAPCSVLTVPSDYRGHEHMYSGVYR